jgi:hypothetical protein
VRWTCWMILTLLPLFAPASWAGSGQDWSTLETPEALHPVRERFLPRWQSATSRCIEEGVWFRDLSSELEVRWRIQEWSPTVATHDPLLTELAIEHTLAGFTMGWERAVREWMRGQPELRPVHSWARSMVNPSIKVQPREGAGATVSADELATQTAAAAFAEIEQAKPGKQNTKPSFRTGSRLNLVRLPMSTDTIGAAKGPQIQPSAISYLQVSSMGVDAARLQVVANVPTRKKAEPKIGWSAISRENLGSRWAAIGEVQASPRNLTRAGLVRGGIELRLPTREPWVLRSNLVSDRARPDGLVEHRAELILRANLDWNVPSGPSGWPLGHRVGAPGPMPTTPPPVGPNQLVPLVQSPVSRTLNDPTLSDSPALAEVEPPAHQPKPNGR